MLIADVATDRKLDGGVTSYLLAVTVSVYGPEVLLAVGEAVRRRKEGE